MNILPPPQMFKFNHHSFLGKVGGSDMLLCHSGSI